MNDLASPHRADWQRELREAIRDPAQLCELLDLDPDLIEPMRAPAAGFALRVPRAYLARMRRGDPRDPLLRQVLPLAAELLDAQGFSLDPLAEAGHSPLPGLLHKYHGRVLLVASGACAVNCRYCFRRHFPYPEHLPDPASWSRMLDYVRHRQEISEVILSGGDPLTLSDRRLEQMLAELAGIGHLRRLRVHTRLPLMIPSRVTDALLEMLTASRLQPVVVLHCNHPHEVDAEVATALGRLRRRGVTLLNQSVLLRGINDCVDTLCALSESLFASGVLPYYLHQLDPVAGAAHFEVADVRAKELHRELLRRLPGYLVPRLVRELAGGEAKLPLADI